METIHKLVMGDLKKLKKWEIKIYIIIREKLNSSRIPIIKPNIKKTNETCKILKTIL